MSDISKEELLQLTELIKIAVKPEGNRVIKTLKVEWVLLKEPPSMRDQVFSTFSYKPNITIEYEII